MHVKKVLYKMATGKLNALKTEKNLLLKKRKLQQYLMQKGFETAIITKVIDELF